MLIGETVIAATAGGIAAAVTEEVSVALWYNEPDEPELPAALSSTALEIDLTVPPLATTSSLTMRTV